MRVLGLDYGSKTVGVAVSDPLGLTAQGVETVWRKQENKLRRTLARIEEIISEYQVTEIVLGYPKNMNNTVGERAEKSLEFKEMLEKRTGLPVVMWDERLTTVAADKTMMEAGIRRENRKVMKRVHEDLPNTQFPVPSGIIQVQVCSQSGKLPIPGLCDGSVYTEYFAEGTEPTESCDVHYQGEICAYDGLPASPDCPFKYTGVATMPLVEDPALQQGSTVIINNPDGTQTVSTPNTRSQCEHDATFFANPDYESVINQQQAEINARNAAAQQPAE